jgi:hypothetical protein
VRKGGNPENNIRMAEICGFAGYCYNVIKLFIYIYAPHFSHVVGAGCISEETLPIKLEPPFIIK